MCQSNMALRTDFQVRWNCKRTALVTKETVARVAEYSSAPAFCLFVLKGFSSQLQLFAT